LVPHEFNNRVATKEMMKARGFRYWMFNVFIIQFMFSVCFFDGVKNGAQAKVG
jgi:hypothetical protein